MHQLNNELIDIVRNPREFISRLMIVDEKGIAKQFNEPHPEQKQALLDFTNPVAKLVVHLKPRQIGDSTVKSAEEFHYLYNTPDPVKTLLVADHSDTTDTLHQKILYYYDTLPEKLKRPLRASNKKEMFFADTGAGIRCLTAGSPQMGKGSTYQRLIAEEMAFWDDAASVWGSVTACVHEGPHHKKFIISTSNGPGNLYHEKVLEAQKAWRANDPRTVFSFFRWCDHSTYSMTPPSDWEPTEEEWTLAKTHALTIEQLYWRHNKVYGPDGIGESLFRMHYPITVEEAFAEHEGSWFDVEYLEAVEASVDKLQGEIRIYESPRDGAVYAAGIDPSWCNGGDYAVLQILDQWGNQVCTYSTNRGGEDAFAEQAVDLIKQYNDARVLVEDNPGGGGKTVRKILESYGCRIWKQPRNGKRRRGRYWNTSQGTKIECFAHLRQMVNGDALTLRDAVTISELIHVREEDGRLEGQDGYHDDHAMALALAEWNRRDLPGPMLSSGNRRLYQAAPNPWTAGAR